MWRHWVVPAIIGQPFLRLYLIAEHTGCELARRAPSEDMANASASAPREQPASLLRAAHRHSRTSAACIWPHAAVRALFWNMPYHAEHHAFPDVPFHALPAVHASLHDEAARAADRRDGRGCHGEGVLSAYWRDLLASRARVQGGG